MGFGHKGAGSGAEVGSGDVFGVEVVDGAVALKDGAVSEDADVAGDEHVACIVVVLGEVAIKGGIPDGDHDVSLGDGEISFAAGVEGGDLDGGAGRLGTTFSRGGECHGESQKEGRGRGAESHG